MSSGRHTRPAGGEASAGSDSENRSRARFARCQPTNARSRRTTTRDLRRAIDQLGGRKVAGTVLLQDS